MEDLKRTQEATKYDYETQIGLLSDQQKAAVFHSDGPCAVTAVPGSGKTMCLTMRIHKLIRDGVSPSRIMACTFTNKAAVEMKTRIIGAAEDPDHLYMSWIGTMHSMFRRMLETSPQWADRLRQGKIPVAGRYFSRLKYIIAAAKTFGDKFDSVDKARVFNEISSAKNNLMNSEQYRYAYIQETGLTNNPAGPGCADIWDYYREYEVLKNTDGMIDFDDMIYRTWEMFELYPSVLERWQAEFDHILVDEFQDINLAQWQVIKMLSESSGNLFVVGDGNQSIYQFRGSRPEFLFNIEQELSDVTKINMSTNYRSGDMIIDYSNKILESAEYYITKIHGIGKPGFVTLTKYASPFDEAVGVVKKIKDLLDNGVPETEIGVIYRLNAVSGGFEIAMARKGIMYRSKTSDGFLGSSIVRDFVAYLKAATSDNCESSLSRILNTPNRYLGVGFRDAWARVMERYRLKPKEALLMDYDKSYWARNARELYYHLQMISSFDFAFEAIDYIRYDMGYEDYISKNSDELDPSRVDMMNELDYIARQYPSIRSLLDEIDKTIQYETTKDAVSLLTIHGSKGLEFDHVFFVSLVDGVIPHKGAKGESEIEEERRMFFVAATRAKKHLHMSAIDDHGSGSSDGESIFHRKPSRFLNDAGSDFVRCVDESPDDTN